VRVVPADMAGPAREGGRPVRVLLAVLSGWLAFAAVYPVARAERGMPLVVCGHDCGPDAGGDGR